MRTITEFLNQEPIFEFEGYVIRPLDELNFFIENPEGEGTSIKKSDFLLWLTNLFDETF